MNVESILSMKKQSLHMYSSVQKAFRSITSIHAFGSSVGVPLIIEDILYITPANRINELSIMDGICITENDSRACLRHSRRTQ